MAEDKPAREKRPQQVFTLLVEVGRKADDGLPKDATGGEVTLATPVPPRERVPRATEGTATPS